MSISRIIEVAGYEVEVVRFSYGSFYYPCINPYSEFEVNSKGFKRLSSYLRFLRFVDKMVSDKDSLLTVLNQNHLSNVTQ